MSAAQTKADDADLRRTFSPERRRRYDEWREATRGQKFVREPMSALTAVIEDRAATAAERVLAWVRREAWGKYSLYAIHDSGRKKIQQDCADELKLDKRRVSAAIAYQIARDRIHVERKKLYAVLAPNPGALPKRDTESGTYRTFLKLWKEANSSDFLALEEARSTVKRLTTVVLSDYRMWRASRTKSGGSKKEEDPGEKARADSSSNAVLSAPSSSSSSDLRTKKTTARAQKQPEETPEFPERLWRHARENTLRPFPRSDAQRYMERCRTAAQGETFTEDDAIAVLSLTAAAAAEPVKKFRYYLEAAAEQTAIWLEERKAPPAKRRAASAFDRALEELDEE